jgi:uncharacterized membrane protein YdjX (TVP38/TMEM64 family)
VSNPDPAGAPDLLAAARRYGPLALIAVLLIIAVASGATRHLSLHDLRLRRAALETLVHAHPAISLCAYVGLYALLVGLSLPAALVMTLAGGMLFGGWVGGRAAAVGCTAGATIAFLACRTALGDTLNRRAGPATARIVEGVRRDAFSYILMLRLIPVTPYWLANLALGLVDIPLATFVTASLLGILPASLIYAHLGSGLNRLFAEGLRPDLHVILQPSVLGPLIALALLALVPVVARRWRTPR